MSYFKRIRQFAGAVLATALSAVASGQSISVVSASPLNGPLQLQPGFSAPQGSYQSFSNTINLARPSFGAQSAVASSTLAGLPSIHAPSFINDGNYGNGRSWIPGTATAWLKIDLGAVRQFNAIQFGRDRLGGHPDRLVSQFMVSVATTENSYANGNESNDTFEYTTVLSSASLGFTGSPSGVATLRASFGTTISARYIRIDISSLSSFACLDEVEVQASVDPATVGTDAISRLVTFGVPVTDQATYGTDAISRLVTFDVPITDQATFGTDAISRLVTFFVPITDQATFGTDAISRLVTFSTPITDPATFGTDAISRLVTFGVPITDQATYGIDAISRLITFQADTSNMTVVGAAAPANVETGSAFEVSWSNKNLSQFIARGPWTDRIYVSTTPDPTGAVALADFPFTGDVAGNSQVNRVQAVTIPRSAIAATGNYYLVFYVDALDVLEEGTNEGDNWMAIPIHVTRNSLPDLTATNLVAPATANSGQSIQVQFQVNNAGTVPTNADYWNDAILISTDDTPGSDPKVVQLSNVTYLPAGSGYTTTGTVTFPRDFYGNYKIIGYADYSGSVSEDNNANNWTSAQSISIIESPFPDLQVTSVSAPTQGFANEPITVGWRTENFGTASTLSSELPWTDQIFLSRDAILDGADILLGSKDRTTGNLAVSGLYDASQSVNLPPSAVGNYFVIVHTDASNRVYESSLDGNNTRASATQINVISTPPDLVIPTFTSIPFAAAGEIIPLDFIVKNQGAFEAKGTWWDNVYFSSDQVLDAADRSLGSWPAGPLAAGLEYRREVTGQIPICNNGRYYLIAKADTSSSLFEFDPAFDAEANNTRVWTIDISDQSANLRFTALTATPTNLNIQNLLNVSYQVENAGNGATEVNSWIDRFYLSTTQTITSDSVLVGELVRNAPLDRGERYQRTAGLRVPSTVPTGNYYLVGHTDSSDAVEECNLEGDNTRVFGTINLTNSITASDPDLVATNLASSSNSVKPFQSFSVNWTVSNQGVGTATGVWGDTVYLSSDTTLSPDDRVLGGATQVTALSVGSSYNASDSVSVPFVTPGNYHLILASDPGNGIRETNEFNNQQTRPITVAAYSYDLFVESVSTPPTGIAGRNISLSWTTKNQGTDAIASQSWIDYAYLSRDQILDPTDRVLGFVAHTSGLGAGQSYQKNLIAALPNGVSGTYYVFVATDRQNVIPETAESNNVTISSPMALQLPPPVDLDVISVTPPATAAPGEPTTFNWLVQNLQPNAIDGDWEDGVYLSTDATWSIDDVLVTRVSRSGGLTAGGSYNGSATVELPGVNVGNYFTIVRTDLKNLVAESNEGNNQQASSAMTAVDVFELTLGQTHNSTLNSGQSRYYKVATPANETMWLTVDGSNQDMFLEAYLRFGQMASLSTYEYQSAGGYSPTQRILVPQTQNGYYYNLTRASQVSGTAQPFGIKPRLLNFEIVDVAPRITGNAGLSTINLVGAQFSESDQIELVRGQTVLTPETQVFGSIRALGVFNLLNTPPGSFDVRIRKTDGRIATLSNAVTVVDSLPVSGEVQYLGPDRLRVGVVAPAKISLVNTSLNDLFTVPMIVHVPPGVTLEPDGSTLNVRNYVLPEFQDISADILAQAPYVDLPEGRFYYLIAPYLPQQSSISMGVRISGQASGSLALNVSIILPSDPDDIISESPGGRSIGSFLASKCFTTVAKDALVRIAQGFLGPRAGGCAAEIAVDTLVYFKSVQLDVLENLVRREGAFNAGMLVGFGGASAQILIKSFKSCAPELATAALLRLSIRAVPFLGWAVLAADIGPSLFNLYNDCLPELKSQFPVSFFVPRDPNDKIGPAGAGFEQWVSKSQTLPYTVNFENVPTATAAAGKIVVTDVLSPNLDPRTFRLGTIAFNNYRVTVPDNRAFYSTRVQLGEDMANMVAEVTAFLNIFTNTVTWTLEMIDPATGLPPLDPALGLLPPNDSSGRGQGYVTYTIQPRANAIHESVIDNSATIVFDTEPPLTTNTVSNKLDMVPPSSQVSALPARVSGNVFDISWTASDDAVGSGLKAVELYASMNNGPYLLSEVISDRSQTTYTGSLGADYRFFTIAIDQAGNREVAPLTQDAGTQTGPIVRPVIERITPAQVERGKNSTVFRVIGKYFVAESVVRVNKIAVPTTFVSPTELAVTTMLPDESFVLIDVLSPIRQGSSEPLKLNLAPYPIVATRAEFLTRNREVNTYRVTISNPTSTARYFVKVNAAAVGGQSTGSTLPIDVGTMPPRSTRTFNLTFTGELRGQLQLQGIYEGGFFKSSVDLTGRIR